MNRDRENKRLGALFGQTIGSNYHTLSIVKTYLDNWGVLTPQTVVPILAKVFKKHGKMNPRTVKHPIATSLETWANSYYTLAPSYPTKYCGIIGTLQPDNLDWVEVTAAMATKALGGFDPRCVASSVAISIALAVLINGGTPSKAYKTASERASTYHPSIPVHMSKGPELLIAPTCEPFQLIRDSFHILRLANAQYGALFKEALRYGGIPTAFAGAYLGVGALPADLIHGHPHKTDLLNLTEQIRCLDAAS